MTQERGNIMLSDISFAKIINLFEKLPDFLTNILLKFVQDTSPLTM